MEGSVCLSGRNFKTSYRCARSEVQLALTMVIVIVWHVMPCSLVEVYVCTSTLKFSIEDEGDRFYHSVYKFLPGYMISHWKYGDHYLGIVVNSAVGDCSVWMNQRGLHHHSGTDYLQRNMNHVLEGAAILFNNPPCASVLMYSPFRMEMHVVNGMIICLYLTYCGCATQH